MTPIENQNYYCPGPVTKNYLDICLKIELKTFFSRVNWYPQFICNCIYALSLEQQKNQCFKIKDKHLSNIL